MKTLLSCNFVGGRWNKIFSVPCTVDIISLECTHHSTTTMITGSVLYIKALIIRIHARFFLFIFPNLVWSLRDLTLLKSNIANYMYFYLRFTILGVSLARQWGSITLRIVVYLGYIILHVAVVV